MSPYVELSPSTGSTTTPGGADTQVQFNNAGAFGGSANLTWNNTTSALGVNATGSATLTAINFGTANTGLFGSSTAVFAATAGTTRWSVDSTRFTLSVPLRMPDGSAIGPSFSFPSGTNSGFYYASGVGISVSGTSRLLLSTTDITSTLPVTLPANPTTALQAATKQYVDNRVAKAGDTMSGALQVNATIASAVTATTGIYYFGSGTTRSLDHNGTNFNIVGGDFLWGGAVNSQPGIGATTLGGALASGSYIAVSRASGAAIHLNTNADGTIQLHQRSGVSVGNISVTTTTTAYNTSSDARLKTKLQAFDAGNIIDATNVYSFEWRSTGERSYGVIAQEANEVYPAAVTHDVTDDRWYIDNSKYMPVVLQELKALRARVAELEGLTGVKPAERT